MEKKKYNCNKIKILYIEGINNDGKIVFPSFRELSEQCSVKYGYLKQHAASENWTKQREIYSTKLALNRLQKKSGLLASESVEFDSKTLELAKAGILQIKAIFLAHKKLMKKAKREKQTIPLLDPKVLDNLSRALMNFQKIGKLALEEQLPPERTQSKIVMEFREEFKILNPEQKKQFVKLALRYEKELAKLNDNDGDSKNG